MSKTYFIKDSRTVDAETVTPNPENKVYKIGSLFSGCGGMDLGFLGDFSFMGKAYPKNPYEIVFSNDIFDQASTCYEANLHHNVIRKSILDITNDELPEGDIDVLLGGFPCQTFSLSGKRKGLSDPRGQLYLEMIRVLQHYRPKVFVAENVDGIRNSKKDRHGESVDKSALDTILEDFDKAGYEVQYKILNAADFGVPQQRRRVIIIGVRRDLGSQEDIFYPMENHSDSENQGRLPWVTSREAIDDLWDMVNKTTIPNHTARDISKAKFYPGRKMQGNNQIKGDRPSPTIRAEHHGNIEAHYRSLNTEAPDDMSGWRRLSVRECARLQSFPDNYNFVCSASMAYKMIGNAVPPVMAWNIARAVLNTLEHLEKEN